MENTDNNNRELLQRYLENRCSPRDWEDVLRLLESDQSARELLKELQDTFRKNLEEPGEQMNKEQADRVLSELMGKIGGASKKAGAPVVRMHRNRWWQLSAAIIAGALLTGIYFLMNNRQSDQKEIAVTGANGGAAIRDDVAPGRNKAVLTLADGAAVSLDDVKGDSLPAQGNTRLVKGNGTLNYKTGSEKSHVILYNTLSTPRGGQYQIVLPDGTRAWLNTASSLRYPTAFAGAERRVEMTGEVYFEVAKNEHMPFVVKAGDAEVEVLGTHFNVMAYTDESALETTLLEGAVRFTHQEKTALLQPGQQSRLTVNGELKKIESTDVDKIIAWKNGYFNFDGVDLPAVLRQLSRWYDVQVSDPVSSNEVFYASIPRNMVLSEVLKALEMTGKVHFEISAGKIIVK